MPMLLGAQRSRYLFRAAHNTAALVVQAQHGGHHAASCRSFQRGGDLLLIAGASGLAAGVGGEPGSIDQEVVR